VCSSFVIGLKVNPNPTPIGFGLRLVEGYGFSNPSVSSYFIIRPRRLSLKNLSANLPPGRAVESSPPTTRCRCRHSRVNLPQRLPPKLPPTNLPPTNLPPVNSPPINFPPRLPPRLPPKPPPRRLPPRQLPPRQLPPRGHRARRETARVRPRPNASRRRW